MGLEMGQVNVEGEMNLLGQTKGGGDLNGPNWDGPIIGGKENSECVFKGHESYIISLKQEPNIANHKGNNEIADLMELRQSLPQILAAALKEAMREGGFGWGENNEIKVSSPRKWDSGQETRLENKVQDNNRSQGITDEDNAWWQQCADLTDTLSPPPKGNGVHISPQQMCIEEATQETTPNTTIRTSSRLGRKRGGEYVSGEDAVQQATRRKEQGNTTGAHAVIFNLIPVDILCNIAVVCGVALGVEGRS